MQATVGAPSSQQNWTLLSLVEWSTNHLTERGFDEARLHVELLLANVLRYSRLQLYTNFDRPLTSEETSRFKHLFVRRLRHEPLQYILGETEFMGLPLYVDSSVLIPRPETELLVERVVETLKANTKTTMDVLDIGTGSGNIPIAIAKLATNARVITIDVSKDALKVARRNVERNNVSNVTLVHADVLANFLPEEAFDIIVSNPPYISLEEFGTLQSEVREFEPSLATTDGGDGYRFIRRIADVACTKLRQNGNLFFEIAYNQSVQARRIVESAGLRDVQIIPDYSGHPRIITARK